MPDPQLHSHVVVLGAERRNGRFAAVDSRELFRAARANGAWYRAELAHRLQRLGLEIRGRPARGGRYFEVAGVPEKLSERWSMRAAQIERAARAFPHRYGRDPSRGAGLDHAHARDEDVRGARGRRGSRRGERSVRSMGSRATRRRGLSRVRSRRAQPDGERPGSRPGAARGVTQEHSTVSDRDLHARAYELAVGWGPPAQADAVVGRSRSRASWSAARTGAGRRASCASASS